MYTKIGFEIKQRTSTHLKKIYYVDYATDRGHTCMKNKY